MQYTLVDWEWEYVHLGDDGVAFNTPAVVGCTEALGELEKVVSRKDYTKELNFLVMFHNPLTLALEGSEDPVLFSPKGWQLLADALVEETELDPWETIPVLTRHQFLFETNGQWLLVESAHHIAKYDSEMPTGRILDDNGAANWCVRNRVPLPKELASFRQSKVLQPNNVSAFRIRQRDSSFDALLCELSYLRDQVMSWDPSMTPEPKLRTPLEIVNRLLDLLDKAGSDICGTIKTKGGDLTMFAGLKTDLESIEPILFGEQFEPKGQKCSDQELFNRLAKYFNYFDALSIASCNVSEVEISLSQPEQPVGMPRTRQRLVDGFWDHANWGSRLARIDKVASNIWPEEFATHGDEIIAKRLSPLIKNTNDSLREAGYRLEFNKRGDYIYLGAW